MSCQTRAHAKSSEAAAPRKGDIVICKFPHDNGTSIAECEIKTRPCLVVGRYRVDGRDYCAVAYGTRSDNKSNYGFPIVVSTPGDMRTASLNNPTRFVLGRMRILPLDREHFPTREFPGAPIGRLPDHLMARLDCCVDMIVDRNPSLAILRENPTGATHVVTLDADSLSEAQSVLGKYYNGTRDVLLARQNAAASPAVLAPAAAPVRAAPSPSAGPEGRTYAGTRASRLRLPAGASRAGSPASRRASRPAHHCSLRKRGSPETTG